MPQEEALNSIKLLKPTLLTRRGLAWYVRCKFMMKEVYNE